jgi:hypothetical protein
MSKETPRKLSRDHPPKGEEDAISEPMPFDDALRILLAAPPQHRTAKDRADKPARAPKPNKK